LLLSHHSRNLDIAGTAAAAAGAAAATTAAAADQQGNWLFLAQEHGKKPADAASQQSIQQPSVNSGEAIFSAA
jgi:hypothetical protein